MVSFICYSIEKLALYFRKRERTEKNIKNKNRFHFYLWLSLKIKNYLNDSDIFYPQIAPYRNEFTKPIVYSDQVFMKIKQEIVVTKSSEIADLITRIESNDLKEDDWNLTTRLLRL